MDEIINPHDKLFRETWSDLATAKSFLRHYLPQAVLQLIDLETLEICKDTFVEKDLKNFYSVKGQIFILDKSLNALISKHHGTPFTHPISRCNVPCHRPRQREKRNF